MIAPFGPAPEIVSKEMSRSGICVSRRPAAAVLEPVKRRGDLVDEPGWLRVEPAEKWRDRRAIAAVGGARAGEFGFVLGGARQPRRVGGADDLAAIARSRSCAACRRPARDRATPSRPFWRQPRQFGLQFAAAACRSASCVR
jgi:hypothetical protein